MQLSNLLQNINYKQKIREKDKKVLNQFYFLICTIYVKKYIYLKYTRNTSVYIALIF